MLMGKRSILVLKPLEVFLSRAQASIAYPVDAAAFLDK
jgi:hypothetical protein